MLSLTQESSTKNWQTAWLTSIKSPQIGQIYNSSVIVTNDNGIRRIIIFRDFCLKDTVFLWTC